MSAGFKFVSKEVEEHSNNDEMILIELSLDEPDLEASLYLVDGNGGEDIETINVN
ncbi:hypothetical protein MTR_4g097005 [Medicago truncatula]|uniref:Uncharacterized protein n=1 Tax=Medicago truncatula TaxID=3880 RepID=A0A072UR56_MEDTR|nr:hypothetical protein MTR_4g097005 [Medicago truncatula]